VDVRLGDPGKSAHARQCTSGRSMLLPYGFDQRLQRINLGVSAINELAKVLWRHFLRVDIVDHTQESLPTN
jgi:hypothetical protein